MTTLTINIIREYVMALNMNFAQRASLYWYIVNSIISRVSDNALLGHGWSLEKVIHFSKDIYDEGKVRKTFSWRVLKNGLPYTDEAFWTFEEAKAQAALYMGVQPPFPITPQRSNH